MLLEARAAGGLVSEPSFFDLPGEVVSGHPDRHVMRVEWGASIFYLKRQHIVGWREKLRNWRAGFGWVSRCEREALLLQQLCAAKLPAPRAAAFGAHGRRAFLLVEEVPHAIDLRQLLNDNALSLAQRRTLAANIGCALAAVHAAGFTTPDLTAKHVLVNPRTLAVTFLDWQSSARVGKVSHEARCDALGALQASLSDVLASHSDRLRVLKAYQAARGLAREYIPPILRAAAKHSQRRSVRDQLQLPCGTKSQRLVWLAGEAVCAIPEVAAHWPAPALAPPFYGGAEGTTQLHFAGRDAILIRGRTVAPLARWRAWLRATPWRSEGVTVGRVLFHLERYGIAAPKLLAFGQRLNSPVAAEWFALYEQPPGVLLRAWRKYATATERRALLPRLLECVRQLHAAGCVLRDVEAAFAVQGGRVVVADPRAVRIVRRMSEAAKARDLRNVIRLLEAA